MESNAIVNKVAADAHVAVDRAAHSASDTAEAAVRLAKPVLERAAQTAHRAVDGAAGIAAPAAQWLDANAEAVRKAPERFVEGGREVVRSHPWKAIGGALALGLLIGRLLR